MADKGWHHFSSSVWSLSFTFCLSSVCLPEHLNEEGHFYLVSPRDVVIAKVHSNLLTARVISKLFEKILGTCKLV